MHTQKKILKYFIKFILCNLFLTPVGAQFIQQGGKLVGTGVVGISSGDVSNNNVALSADGNTAIVGRLHDNNYTGAAWVYTRSGDVWTQQGNKLVGTGAVGAAYQGTSVSISGDGNTVIVGGIYDNNYTGAAWVYTRSGDVWTQQGNKLVGTGAVGSASQGFSVSLSTDGNTAIEGGHGDDSYTGAAWVYTRSGDVWTQQGNKLVGTGTIGTAYQGCSVSLSADGNRAIIGGPGDDSYTGAAWVYTRSGDVWTQQGNKLVGTGALGAAYQGLSVSVSGNGNTAIVDGPSDNGSIGATWIYSGGRTPVIFIPGIMGSPLYNSQDNHLVGTERIWVDQTKTLDHILYPHNSFLDVLQLNANGADPADPNDTIKVAPIRNDARNLTYELDWSPLSFYKELLAELTNQPNGYILDNLDNNHDENEDLFCFTYDWRKTNVATAESLKALIDSVTHWTGANRVSIVAHSMGGLITEKYVQKYHDVNVNKIIFVGTPHIGAPKAYYVALTGDLQLEWYKGIFINPDEIKKIGRNFPTTYQLFPSQTYFNIAMPFHVLPDNVSPRSDVTVDRIFSTYNYNGVTYNEGLILKAHDFRRDIDYVDFGTIKVFNIVGGKKNTIGEVYYNSRTGMPDPKYTQLGDGTVPLLSSTSINHTCNKPYHVASGVNHSDLCNDETVRKKIWEILNASPTASQKIMNLQEDTLPPFVANNYTIKVDHEVNLQVYDSLGRHTGPTSDTSWEANIPGSEYIPGDVHQANSLKVVILPRDGNYHFVVESQDTTSHFNLVLDDIVDGNQIVSVAYDSIATLPNSIARSTFQSITTDLNLVVDNNGDSTELIVRRPSTIQITTTARDQWNMVSIPVTLFDSLKVTLFPNSISNSYWYNPGLGYQTADTMHTCRGYWLKFDSTEVIPFYGVPHWVDTIAVQEGWNLVGTISTPIISTSIISEPSGLITSQFFGYNGGYEFSDTIYPGKAYWIKVNQDGKLILNANLSAGTLAKNRIKMVSTSEMPPPPPGDISSADDRIPQSYTLEQAYPSPFNPTTTIKYGVPTDSRVTLKIYNVLGQVVHVLADNIESAGYKSATWVATDAASGIYFYRLDATSINDAVKSFTQVKKMVLVK